jgi:hypothetical protein
VPPESLPRLSTVFSHTLCLLSRVFFLSHTLCLVSRLFSVRLADGFLNLLFDATPSVCTSCCFPPHLVSGLLDLSSATPGVCHSLGFWLLRPPAIAAPKGHCAHEQSLRHGAFCPFTLFTRAHLNVKILPSIRTCSTLFKHLHSVYKSLCSITPHFIDSQVNSLCIHCFLTSTDSYPTHSQYTLPAIARIPPRATRTRT